MLEIQLGIASRIPLRHFGLINNEKEKKKQLLEPNPKYGSFLYLAHFYISWLTSLLLQKYMESENTVCVCVCVCL